MLGDRKTPDYFSTQGGDGIGGTKSRWRYRCCGKGFVERGRGISVYIH